jgi:hypothetical protein
MSVALDMVLLAAEPRLTMSGERSPLTLSLSKGAREHLALAERTARNLAFLARQDENKTGVCGYHHHRCIHPGHVRVWGRAPDELTWIVGGKVWRRTET